MSSAELNQVLGFAVGIVFAFFAGVRFPSLASMLQPVQIWTSNRFSNLLLDATGIRYLCHVEDTLIDNGMQKATATVASLGGKIWHYSVHLLA